MMSLVEHLYSKACDQVQQRNLTKQKIKFGLSVFVKQEIQLQEKVRERFGITWISALFDF